MPKILECARCGAGISHTDSQCWRCGEPLKGNPKAKASSAVGKSPAPGIKDIKDLRPRESSTTNSSLRPLVTGDYNGREKELQDREKELREAMDALEEESKELEAVAMELEKERLSIEASKKRIQEREDELDAMALIVQETAMAAQEYQRTVTSDKEGVQRFKELMAHQAELGEVLEEERARIRRSIERDMADQLSRIAQLEAELKAANATIRESQGLSEPSPIDIKQVLGEITQVLSSQIGAGMAEGQGDHTVRTGIEGLDKLLSGGIPAGSVVLINGPAGSMKTSLAYHILHHSARDKVKSLFLSLEQDRDSLLRQMERLGMPREESLDDLIIVDLVDLRRSMEGQSGDWRNIIQRYVENVMKDCPFQLIALDSLESFISMSEVKFSRIETQDLFDWFRSLGLTTFVISETPMTKLENDGAMELYVADGALELALKEVGDSRIQRWIRCIKMRGANIDPRFHNMMHAGNTFILSLPMMRASPQSGD
ncbi:MAG: AAA family ATPase [Methanomassiliicoccus sp.]|nr:AAA family ATPase [Methanomassiliicoccus sp.]